MASKNKQKNKFATMLLEQKKANDLANALALMTQERAEDLFDASMKSGEIGQLRLTKNTFHFPHENPELIAAIKFLGDTDYFFQEVVKLELKRQNLTLEDLDQMEDFEDYEN
jgi:hypothetical protein